MFGSRLLHTAQLQPEVQVSGPVRVKGRRRICIQTGTMKFVPTACWKAPLAHNGSALFEPLDTGLPHGFLSSPPLVRVVIYPQTVFIPITNLGLTEAILPPHSQLGTLCQVEIVSQSDGLTSLLEEVGAEKCVTMATEALCGLPSVKFKD